MKFVRLLVLTLFLTACTPRCEQVDTFILDSYRIKEGKQAICELQGKELIPFTKIEQNEDTIEENDTLLLTSDQQELKHLALKVLEGNLTIPKLGTISVQHLTLSAAKEKILSYFSDEIPQNLDLTFLDKPRVIKIIGSEKNEFSIQNNTRLLDVLYSIGLSQEIDLFHSQIKRANENLNIDFVRLLYNEDHNQNILLQPNDTLIIAKTQPAITLVFPDQSTQFFNAPKGYLSIKELLIQANISLKELSAIKIVRNQILNPKTYILNWRHLIYLPNESLYLMQGDLVVVVKKTSIARFLHKFTLSSCWFF